MATADPLEWVVSQNHVQGEWIQCQKGSLVFPQVT